MIGYSDVKRWAAARTDRWLGINAGRDSVERAVDTPTSDARKNYLTYDPSYYLNLLWGLRRFAGRNDVFLDLGCGAGRAVCIAARVKRMRRCIGVEYHPPLAELAERNARSAMATSRTPIEIVCADATTWTVPRDVTIVYLYNPFVDEVFDEAIGQVLASIDRAPRTVTLLYTYPTQRARLLATGRAKPVGQLRGRRSDPEKAASLTTEAFELA